MTNARRDEWGGRAKTSGEEADGESQRTTEALFSTTSSAVVAPGAAFEM
jgi:hypothetical protein